jgi:HEAT repeat protein
MDLTNIQELLDSQDYGDRLSGLNHLRKIPDQDSFRMILPLLKDVNARVRYGAVSQMDRLGYVDLDKSLDILLDCLLNDSETDVKAAAADALGGLKLTAAFDDLKNTYENSSEWLLQFSIIAALGEMGDPRSFNLLQSALSSPNELIRTAAISSLGELGVPQAIPLLLKFENDPDWQIRYRLAQALGNFQTQETQDVLQRLALDPFEQVSLEAKHNLHK